MIVRTNIERSRNTLTTVQNLEPIPKAFGKAAIP